jgi:hypothetical protein
LISAAAVAVTALATEVSDVGLLLGETLPFYATIFILFRKCNGNLHSRIPLLTNIKMRRRTNFDKMFFCLRRLLRMI